MERAEHRQSGNGAGSDERELELPQTGTPAGPMSPESHASRSPGWGGGMPKRR